MRYTLRLSIVLPLQKLIPIEKFFSFSPLLLSLFHRPLALSLIFSHRAISAKSAR